MGAPAAKDRHLYEQVAARLISAIESGTLRPGDRMPSIRKLARQQRCSVSTVLQAYLHLESLGLVEVRPQSGHYVKYRPHAMPAEPEGATSTTACCIPRTGELVLRVLEGCRNPRMVALGSGAVSADLLPTRRLMRLIAAVARVHADRCVSYEASAGAKELRHLLARRSVEWGCALDPDEIIVTSGAMEALELCLKVTTRPGDAVAVETPTVYWLLQVLESMGLRVVEVPTHPRDGIEIEALESAIGEHGVKACLLVPSFSNPLGSCMPDERRRALIEMLEGARVPLIEDDVYGDLHHAGIRPRVAKSFEKEGCVLLCSSVSKTLAPGLRVGWVAAGPWRDRLHLMKGSQSGASATLPQLAIAEFLRTGGYDHHLRGLRRQLARNLERLSALVAQVFPAGTRVGRPAGGMFLWLEMPEKADALELFERAHEKRIVLAPGPIFSATGRFGSSLRLSFAQPWTDRHEAALTTVGKMAREMCAG